VKITKLRKLCAALSEATLDCRTMTIDEPTYFKPCLVAAYAKSLEFSLYVQRMRSRDVSFFLLGTLRGICEDYITLQFLKSLEQTTREEVTRALFGRAQGESLRAQGEYFRRHRPYQLVLSQPKEELDDFLRNMDTELRRIGKSLGWSFKGTSPTTWYMANSIGEADLYSYLFHATSNLVHFNPRVLMEMGWGELGGQMTFSPKNFHGYYYSFSVFYSALLLTKACTAFSGVLGLTPQAIDLATQIRTLLDAPGRWPELITPEAMNLKPNTMDQVRHVIGAMMEEEKGNGDGNVKDEK
jgi:hypothetical protein